MSDGKKNVSQSDILDGANKKMREIKIMMDNPEAYRNNRKKIDLKKVKGKRPNIENER